MFIPQHRDAKPLPDFHVTEMVFKITAQTQFGTDVAIEMINEHLDFPAVMDVELLGYAEFKPGEYK